MGPAKAMNQERLWKEGEEILERKQLQIDEELAVLELHTRGN